MIFGFCAVNGRSDSLAVSGLWSLFSVWIPDPGTQNQATPTPLRLVHPLEKMHEINKSDQLKTKRVLIPNKE